MLQGFLVDLRCLLDSLYAETKKAFPSYVFSIKKTCLKWGRFWKHEIVIWQLGEDYTNVGLDFVGPFEQFPLVNTRSYGKVVDLQESKWSVYIHSRWIFLKASYLLYITHII